MNKQELIDKYEPAECVVDFVSGTTLLKNIRRDLEQLDEPQPVKVPQFATDVIEGARGQSVELEDAFEYAWEVATIEFREWFRKLENRNNFARAWLDGYDVEEEKRYRVRLKGFKKGCNCLNHDTKKDEWNFMSKYGIGEYRTAHTRKELEEANFGWVFDCPGIEIEEVE